MSIPDHNNALAIRVSGFQPRLDAPQSLASLQETKIVQLSLTCVLFHCFKENQTFSNVLLHSEEGQRRVVRNNVHVFRDFFTR